ncbi:MAG: LD-carboxypeptidase [Bacteroidales bacterium]|nr:LD-carboxypeptidase [Clostridium sp.]MCM1204870.1 LD-carboxypeptidase [Bacteroidales bacterium]
MQNRGKAGITVCSDGLPPSGAEVKRQLRDVLEKVGITPVFSDYLYAGKGKRSGTAKKRADALMEFYANPEIDAVFDISGGDIANEILPYLDYTRIAEARNRAGKPKRFWGYSDLTVVLNAIYAKTGNSGVLYQVRHLTEDKNAGLLTNFADAVCPAEDSVHPVKNGNGLFDFGYSFIQGEELSGVVVGGNIRCLLKLAGTEYFPDLTDKILFLEARSGLEPQIITYFSQLRQLGAFDKVNGLLLGTFTQLEREEVKGLEEEHRIEMSVAGRLVKELVGKKLPVARTAEIGHAADSKGIIIGKPMKLVRQ